MTNDTTPTENGAADAATMLAVMQNDTPESTSEIAVAEEPKPPSFDDLGLHADVKLALDDMGYFAPTPVQTAVFKPVNEGKDLLVQSRTGTGKTTAFGLPLINKLVPAHRQPQAMILCPTRELALQVARELTQLGKHRGIVIEAVYGGAPIGKQIAALRNGVHIIVGTPGRVLDHIGRRTLDCKTISTFVLDECDEMLSMGFLEDIERVTSNLPEKHQTLLFSATMPVEVERYARRHMKNQEQISLSRDSISVTDIHHAYYIVSGIARSRDLLKILFAENPESAIIFCNTRDETTMVAKFLTKQGLDAEPLSSDLSQADRERVMARTKAKTLKYLCATDVAARGIDISSLSHVINYSVPESPEVYVHRTGRTGRMGKKGTALSLVGPRELGNFRYVRLTFGIKPEERLLPKDDIFVGKLKVPLPPIGLPQAPDPVQILIRGVPQTPTDLEKAIFEKLVATVNGKRVLAALVAEKLNQLSTKSSPRQRPPVRVERTEGAPEGGDAPREDRGDRPRFDGPPGEGGPRRDYGDRDRSGGGDRGGRFDRDRGPRGGGDRPRFGGDDRGPRDGGGDRGPRDGGDRGPRDGGGDRGPREGSDRPRFGGDGDRPRFDRDRGGDRPRFDRDRGPRDDRGREDRDARRAEGTPTGEARPAGEVTTEVQAGASTEARPARDERPRDDRPRDDRPRDDRPRDDRPRDDRGDRYGRDRDRGGRGGDRDRGGGRHYSDRDRGGARDTVETTTAPVVAQDATAPVEIEAVIATSSPEATVDARPEQDRGDRGDRGGRDRDRGGRDRGGRDRDRGGRDRDRDRGPDRNAAPVAAAAVEAPAAVEAEAEVEATVDDVARSAVERAAGHKKKDKRTTEVTEATREFWETWADNKATREPEVIAEVVEVKEERKERGARAERGGRSRGGRGRGDKKEAADAEKTDDAPPARAKRDTAVTAAADANQARLFVSLGKKHGVSADDLRNLLAGPLGGDTARIGSVSLRDSHAHVRVPEELVDAIIAGVHGTLHNEHNVTVERSRA